MAPEYLAGLIKPYSPGVILRSSNKFLLTIPRARLKLKGDRAFSIVGPRLWNNLPLDVRSSLILNAFQDHLK